MLTTLPLVLLFLMELYYIIKLKLHAEVYTYIYTHI